MAKSSLSKLKEATENKSEEKPKADEKKAVSAKMPAKVAPKPAARRAVTKPDIKPVTEISKVAPAVDRVLDELDQNTKPLAEASKATTSVPPWEDVPTSAEAAPAPKSAPKTTAGKLSFRDALAMAQKSSQPVNTGFDARRYLK
jgi:hypothetical protein